MPDRIAQLREQLNQHRLDVFLISSLTHIRYLFGFTGSNALAAVTPDRCLVITDKRYREQVKHEVTGADIAIADQDLFVPLNDKLSLQKGMRLGFEAAYLSFKQFSHLQKLFKSIQLVATENILERITLARLPHEVDYTRKACEISRAAWEAVLPCLRPGVSELDVAAEISYQCKKRGAERDAFEPIVASGWRSALPHGTASRKTLQRGDLVVIDFGCCYSGFNSDITRTVCIGKPTPEQRRMYEAVKEAQQRALDALQAGMKAVDLDQVAREHLKSAGYDKAFSHSLGHGLGLEVHSKPKIGPKSKDTIPADSIITVEPGVYIPEIGGVRIEDDVFVSSWGPEILTRIDRELLVIE